MEFLLETISLCKKLTDKPLLVRLDSGNDFIDNVAVLIDTGCSFIINRGSNRYYIQSALNVDTKEKQVQETESLRRTGDSFKKVVIVRNNIVPRFDDDGILYIGVEDFLLDETTLDL